MCWYMGILMDTIYLRKTFGTETGIFLVNYRQISNIKRILVGYEILITQMWLEHGP